MSRGIDGTFSPSEGGRRRDVKRGRPEVAPAVTGMSLMRSPLLIARVIADQSSSAITFSAASNEKFSIYRAVNRRHTQ